MKGTQHRRRNWLLWSGILLCTLYQSYRYPLQINSSNTSPTYTDTPFALQIGKFLLVCPLMFWAAMKCIRRPLPSKFWLLVLAVVYLLSLTFLKTFFSADLTFVEVAFWMIFGLLLAWAAEPISERQFDLYLRFLLGFALISNLIEVLLLIFFGRLPALAYEGTLSIRFGSFLDDPNGFSVLLFMLLGWAYGRFTGWKRKGLIAALVLSLIISQSWTAILFFFLFLLVSGILDTPRRPLRSALILGTFALLVLLIVHNLPAGLIETLREIQEAKRGSIQGHGFPLSEIVPRWKEWIWHGQWGYLGYESWWLGSLVNFGFPWWCVDVLLCGYIVFSFWRKWLRSTGSVRPVYLGLFLYGMYFVFGSLNLPFPLTFPVNALFYTFGFLVVLGKLDFQEDNESELTDGRSLAAPVHS